MGLFSNSPKRNKNFKEIKNIAKYVELFCVLEQLAVSKMDYILIGLLSFIYSITFTMLGSVNKIFDYIISNAAQILSFQKS